MKESERTYKLSKTLVLIGSNIAQKINHFTERSTQLYEILMRAVFRKVSKVHHLRSRHCFVNSEGRSHGNRVNEQSV